jgi:hypothetical protein
MALVVLLLLQSTSVSAMRILILPVQLVVNVTAGMHLPLVTSVVHMNAMTGGTAPLAYSTDSKFYPLILKETSHVAYTYNLYLPYSLCMYVCVCVRGYYIGAHVD